MRITTGSKVRLPTLMLKGSAVDQVADRASSLYSDKTILWTGTQLEFTAPIEIQVPLETVGVHGRFTIIQKTDIYQATPGILPIAAENVVIGMPTISTLPSNVSTVSRTSNVVTATTALAHGLTPGMWVWINGVLDGSFNGVFEVTAAPTTTTIQWAQTAANASSTGGYCGRSDLTAGLYGSLQEGQYCVVPYSTLLAINEFRRQHVQLFRRIDNSDALGQMIIPLHKQLVRPGTSTYLGEAGAGGSGDIKITFYDPISTSLPAGSSVTIDGIAGQNGDLVLFSNLGVNNNRVYELQGVGVAITWTPKQIFSGASLTPALGDTLLSLKGVGFAGQRVYFNGTTFVVNDVVRFFSGADYWEMSSLKTLTVADNTTNATVFSVTSAGTENVMVDYSIVRGAQKETGTLILTTVGTNVQMAQSNAYVADTGVTFSPIISAGNLILRYSSDSQGIPATLKYYVRRWSDAAGGPGGIPSYAGGGGGGGLAAGSTGDIQINNAGNLAADARFNFDTATGDLVFGGLRHSALSANITINDNQVLAASLLSYPVATFQNAIVEYSISRNGDIRTGRLLVANNGLVAAMSDDFVETSPVGVTFTALVSGSNLFIQYTSTGTGFTGAFRYSVRKWT